MKAVGVFKKADYDMTKLSIVGKDDDAGNCFSGYYNTGDKIRYWGKAGDFWCDVWGLLIGSAFFLAPELGPIVVGGPIVWLINGVLNHSAAVDGVSVLGSALCGIGIPEERANIYENSLRSGQILLIAHGIAAEIARARDILRLSNALETNIYHNASQESS